MPIDVEVEAYAAREIILTQTLMGKLLWGKGECAAALDHSLKVTIVGDATARRHVRWNAVGPKEHVPDGSDAVVALIGRAASEACDIPGVAGTQRYLELGCQLILGLPEDRSGINALLN